MIAMNDAFRSAPAAAPTAADAGQAAARRARRLARLACAGVAVLYEAMIDGHDDEALALYARSVGAVLGRDYADAVEGVHEAAGCGVDIAAATRETLVGLIEDIDAEIARLCACTRG